MFVTSLGRSTKRVSSQNRLFVGQHWDVAADCNGFVYGLFPMGGWTFILNRWPRRELEIRERCARDPEFASFVEDYCEARTALRYWGEIDPTPSARIADYEELVEELEAEIEAGLSPR